MKRSDKKLEPVGSAKPIDAHVGARLRLRRTLSGLTQTDLGNAVNLTFQQIQKYERGANRIGSGRLYQFARILGVPVSFFFDDMSEDIESADPIPHGGRQGPVEHDLMNQRETLKLIRAYYGIDSAAIRSGIYDLARSLGDVSDAELEDAS